MKMNFLEYGLGKGNEFWKYPIVLIVTFIGMGFLGAIPLLFVTGIFRRQSDGDRSWIDNMDFEAIGMSLNLGLFLMLLIFAIGLWIFLGFIKVMHGSTYKEITNGTKKIRWNRVWVGVITWGTLMTISHLSSFIGNPSNFVFQFDVVRFIPLLLISLIFIPLQTSFEELTFRGYFAQGLARVTRSRWVAFLVPSILFGLMHFGNPEVAEHGFWIMMPTYILIGLVWGLVSILDDGIELALGAHAINNVFISLFFTYSSGAFQTYAVFEVLEINPVRSLIAISLYSAIFVAFLSWKYKWDFSILNKRVEIKEEENINVDTQ